MKTNRRTGILSLVEGALMLALAFVMDVLCKLIPFQFPFGGGISVAVLPLIYFTYRRGTLWGLCAGGVYAVLQIVTGWYPPPAGTWWAFILCILLDYVLAFTVTGLSALPAGLFGERRLAGYAFGGFVVCLLRFLCSFLSGVILWGSHAPEGMGVWLYSFLYNGGYMIPNAVLTALCTYLLCRAVDPRTLRAMKRSR